MMNTAVDNRHPSIQAAISHELRIPLTGILATANFLNQTSLNPQQKYYLNAIQVYAKQLLGLESKLYIAVKSHKKMPFSAKSIMKTAYSLKATPLNTEQKEYMSIMLTAAQRLGSLKQTILAFTKAHNFLPA